jgi:hypothetical protein
MNLYFKIKILLLLFHVSKSVDHYDRCVQLQCFLQHKHLPQVWDLQLEQLKKS